MKVVLHDLKRAGPKQTAISHKAVALLEQALNDPGFDDAFLGRRFSDLYFRDYSGRRTQLTKEAALAKIRSGSELDGSPDGQIDLRVKLDKLKKGTVGVWNGGLEFRTNYIWINRWISQDRPENLAGHFAHEWAHVCGFRHRGKKVRPDVAYNLGKTVIAILDGTVGAKDMGEHFYDYLDCGQQSGSVLSDEELAELMR